MDYKKARENLVEKLKNEGRINSIEVEKAFLKVPREKFVPNYLKNQAYIDTPLQIGRGQTISAPHMVAIMAEKLDLKIGLKILEIGAGSGYHAAIVATIIGEKSTVYSIERFSDLAENAKNNLKNANIKNVKVIVGDGSIGYSQKTPYDRIYLTCAAPDIPNPLIKQLNDPGKIMVPVGRLFCSLKLLEKNKGKIIEKDLGGCAFVPLIGKHGY